MNDQSFLAFVFHKLALTALIKFDKLKFIKYSTEIRKHSFLNKFKELKTVWEYI